MKIVVHAGHNPDGKIACGAVGYIKESTVARQIKDELHTLLIEQGHEVIDATVENGISQSNILNTIVKTTNSANAELAISIHLNSASSSTANGVEAWIYPSTPTHNVELAKVMVDNIANYSLMRNRGVKYSDTLYILKHINCPTILLECGFVSSPVDAAKIDPIYIATGIAASLGHVLEVPSTGDVVENIDPGVQSGSILYRVQVGAFRSKSNAEKLAEELEFKGYDTIITKV